MRNSSFVWASLGSCLLSGCGFVAEPASTASGVVKEATAGAPVALQLANAYEHHELGAGGSCPCSYFTGMSGVIEVEDLGDPKDVAVHLRDSSGSGWRDVAARYLGPAAMPGKELFVFEVPRITTGYVTGSFTFALRYAVGSVTYWDNHGGWNYEVKGPAYTSDREGVLGTAQVGLGYAYFYKDAFSGGVLVKNIAPDKQVGIVYSLDGWRTTRVVSAHYGHAGIPGQEWWEFSDPVAPGTNAADFAIAYQVDGATYWDNNQGANYHLENTDGGTYQFPR